MRTAATPLLILYLACAAGAVTSVAAPWAEPWRSRYEGEDASGPHVIALWQFLPGKELEDSSGQGHTLTLHGAELNSAGLFGGALQCGRGWPIEDKRHAAVARHHVDLSPRGPFTVELWIKPQPEFSDYPEAFLLDKKYVAHDDYQFTLARPDQQGQRQLHVVLGFGQDSEHFWSPQRVALQPGRWYHVAFTYDAAGKVTFWVNAENLGWDVRPGRGGIHAGRRDLSIGDRLGSYYHGFPGLIDQVRITRGVREFRPAVVSSLDQRTAFLRMEPAPAQRYVLQSLSRQTIEDAQVTLSLDGLAQKTWNIPQLKPGEKFGLEYPLDTSLRPGQYTLRSSIEVPDAERAYHNVESFPITIVPRPRPQRMPVVMWGGLAIDGMATLKRIGFTHCLGLRVDYSRVWQAGQAVEAVDDRRLGEDRRFLDQALRNDVRVVAQLHPGRWLEDKQELLRVDRAGKPYSRRNISASMPQLRQFCFNVGASAARTWGDHPALDGALIHTEIRDGTQVSFHPHEREAFRRFAGFDIPDVVTSKSGVAFPRLQDVPENRILADDHPVYLFYKWFWKNGDGWNDLHSAVHDGFRSTGRDNPWTFFDPAVRVPSVWGSGGNVDFISQWTYSYPDPIRIGLATDELLAMASGAQRPQGVMKMTQIIWYRSQTAPQDQSHQKASQPAPWEDFDPGAVYITIAPMHLREAFWTKIARPVKGIMYHGWGSLVPTAGTSAYRYTHPQTQHELARLIHDVVEPLGPTLMQIPIADVDVALLESFASQMFAGRGTWGWGHRWTGDAWHVLQYAQLQTDIVYEETINRDGLEDYKILVMPSCDVLPVSVAERVAQFHKRGGIIIGDERLSPAIQPDIVLRIHERTKQADRDKQELLKIASELRSALDAKYRRYVDSSNPEVVTHYRRFGTTDYVFLVNDRREFGDYVGHHGLVMERGLPAETTLTIARDSGHVYDLLNRRQVIARPATGGGIDFATSLGPAGGGIFMVTERPIERVALHAPSSTVRGESIKVDIATTDAAGRGIHAVVPLRIDVFDPDGRRAEYSGHYGAVDGRVELTLDMAANDTLGVWEVRAQELASGIISRCFFRCGE